jgi:hydroxypyruvate isomerase
MRLAANLSMMFGEHAFMDRFAAAALAGFEAVEFLFPYEFAPEELAARITAASVRPVLFNAPPGDWAKGERGLACLAGREAEYREGIARALAYARHLGVPRLHVMAGIPRPETPRRESLARLRAALAHAVSEGAASGVTILCEPLNPHDMPGYLLADFGAALDLIAMVPGLRLQFDIYHCARIHGTASVAGWIARAAPVIGHFQIAGVPGRHEPDYGELPLGPILEAVRSHGGGHWIGCEYRPAGRTEEGLGWLRRAGLR